MKINMRLKMKNKLFIIILLGLFSFPIYSQISVQEEGMFGMHMPERVEKYKKMRLIEELGLLEENAVRFNVKSNAHEENMRELMKMRRELEDKIANQLKFSDDIQKDPKELTRILKDFEKNQIKIEEERLRYIQDLKKLLTTEQMAKFYIFQRKFEKELREAIKQLRKESPRGRMKERRE